MSEIIAGIVMTIGSLFVLVATVGLHRFDDVFSRIHAAGKASTLGLGLVAVGAAIRFGDLGSVMLLVVVVVFAVVTLPAGTHLIARAAWRAGTELAPDTHVDEESRRILD